MSMNSADRYRVPRGSPRDGTLPTGNAWSPENWNGHTTYSVTPERAECYEPKCITAGHTGEMIWLTQQQAVNVSKVGLTPCPACNGWRTLELAFGMSSSPRAAAPVRTAAQPVRAVPRIGSLP